MDTAHDEKPETIDNLKSNEALPPFVSYQVSQEALEQAPASSGAAEQRFRHGRAEAEARRISEEVTREAQERRRVEQAEHDEVGEAQVASDAPTVAPSFPLAMNLPAPRKMRRFFVPLDGTLAGERTLPYVSALANLLKAQVLLGHVTAIEPPAMLGQVFRTSGVERQISQQAFAPEALPYLRQVREGLASVGAQADLLHITAPTVAEGLLQIEVSSDIELVFVALGAHGESDRMKVGRVADSLIRLGAAPVMVIPPAADVSARPFKLERILVTLDGSTLAEQALGLLLGLLEPLRQQGDKPSVTLLAVAEDYSILSDYQSYLDTLCGALAAQPQLAGVRLSAKVEVGSAPGAIVGAVEHGIGDMDGPTPRGAQPVDMLIMTTHGRGGISRWLFGSVAHYVLPRVHAPVLLTRPGLSEKR